MKPILKVGLSGSGVMNNLARVVVFGPHSRQGLAYKHLYTEQGIQHVARFQRFTQDKNNMSGQLMIANLQEMKMYLGLNGPIFSHSYKRLGHLVERSYCQWTWEFLDTYGMRLDDNTPDFKFYREGDGLLMDAFLRAGYRGKDLKRLNECRLYLRIVCNSEVLFGCGMKVDPA